MDRCEFTDKTLALSFPFVRGADGTQLIKTDASKLQLKFLHHYLYKNEQLCPEKYERHMKYLKAARIPLPPLAVQKKIVAECEKVDAEYTCQQKYIADGRAEIAALVSTAIGPKIGLASVCSINDDAIDPHSTPDKQYTYVDIDAVENGTGTISYNQKMIGRAMPSRARRLAKVGDVIISTVRPNLKGFAFVAQSVEDCVFSTGFAVLRGHADKLVGKYLYSVFMYSALASHRRKNAKTKRRFRRLGQSDFAPMGC